MNLHKKQFQVYDLTSNMHIRLTAWERCIPFLINNKEREGKSVSNMRGMNAQWSWEFSFRVHRIPLRDHCNPTDLKNNPAVDKKCLLLYLPYFRLFVKLYKAFTIHFDVLSSLSAIKS